MNTSFKLSKRLVLGRRNSKQCHPCCRGTYHADFAPLSHRLIVMKLMDFYRLSVCLSSSSASFLCSFHRLFIILWLWFHS